MIASGPITALRAGSAGAWLFENDCAVSAFLVIPEARYMRSRGRQCVVCIHRRRRPEILLDGECGDAIEIAREHFCRPDCSA